MPMGTATLYSVLINRSIHPALIIPEIDTWKRRPRSGKWTIEKEDQVVPFEKALFPFKSV